MGKRALTPDTPVLMYVTGLPKRADEIKIGDIVIGDDGSSRIVINTLSGTSQIYKIKQSHGDDYCVSSEHILTLKYRDHALINWCENLSNNGYWVIKWYDKIDKKIHTKKVYVVAGLTKEQALKDIENFRKTIDVNPIDIHIKDYLSLPKYDRILMHGVKLNTPIKWESKNVHIDPRILGMWLGYGGNWKLRKIINDIELIEYWKTLVKKERGYILDIDNVIQCEVSKNIIFAPLKTYNLINDMHIPLINNMHIPEDYIINDVDGANI